MKMTRLVTTTVAGMALMAMLSGCSNSGSSSSSAPPAPTASATGTTGVTQLAFVVNNPSAYWDIAKAGVDTAAKELGPGYSVDFIVPADGTAATQKQEVNDALAKGVKAIAISPVDPKNQTPWLNDVASKAALITQDSDAADSKRLCYLGTDNHAAGLLAGKLIKEALPQGGKIMLFVGTRDAQNAHDREQGIRDAIKGGNIQIIDVRTDNADHALAKTNAADAIVANPDLAMEVGLWSYNGPAILSAVQGAHKVGKVKIVCFDQEKDTLSGVTSGAIYATVVQNPYQFGYQGTKLLAALSKGDKSGLPVNGTIFFPAQAVKSANVVKYVADLEKETGKSWH